MCDLICVVSLEASRRQSICHCSKDDQNKPYRGKQQQQLTMTADIKIIQYQADEDGNEPGTYIKPTGFKPPAPQPGMLNQEMAEAAAKIFKEKEKDIQAACAKVDAKQQETSDDLAGRETAPKGGCCIIL